MNIFQKKSDRPGRLLDCLCGECGCRLDKDALHNHMVEKHGYIRAGAQVFKRVLCQYKDCGAPGLYKVGVHISCGAHKRQLQVIAVRKAIAFDSGVASQLAEHLDTIDRRLRQQDGVRGGKSSLRGLRTA